MVGVFEKQPDGSLVQLNGPKRFLGFIGVGGAAQYRDLEFAVGTPTDPPPDPDPTDTVMLMGCSASPNDHGATENWDFWRTYSYEETKDMANRAEPNRPLGFAMSIKSGLGGGNASNLGGASPNYTTVYNYVLDTLNDFYYVGGAGSTTPSTRSDQYIYWSNGNENHDKGALGLPHTTAGIAAFALSQKALYDAVHFEQSPGVRRFPRAFAGSNPTQNAEQSGLVADYLSNAGSGSAQYHDFIMWSMYPPGRQNTEPDPTFNWPSFSESDRTNSTLGFLIRCFYRTKQAEARARIDSGNATRTMMIGCGEVGIGDDPDDEDTRPYYAVYGLAHGMLRLSAQYQLPMPFACWWDNQTDAGSPQNILTDEPQAGGSTNPPSTRVAWQNHLSYNIYRGGTKPAAWVTPATPRSAWKTSGSHPTS